MSVSPNQPASLNMLSPLKFQFMVKKLPNVNFFCQSVSMPNVTLGIANVGTPFVKLQLPGDHLEYSELLITFMVDENMVNYIEMYNWMLALGFPESFNQYKALEDIDSRLNPTGTDQLVSDASMFIYNSASNPNVEVKFINLWPSTMSDINFDIRNTDVEYIECTVSFAFERYDVIPL
tara:strand:- start:1245 stop:1778 length:534 start_codon:yes stop_codon:yes gene_type:complete